MRLQTKTITLEGCDLSGKSTFYAQLHKATNFSYDIRDRGMLSRAVYPKIFGRDGQQEWADVLQALDDLNSVFVILAPEWDTITARFASRGDEMHDLNTLRKTWEEFNTLALALQDHPSVLVCRDVPSVDEVVLFLRSRESITTSGISDLVMRSLTATGRNESLDTRFVASFDVRDNPGTSCMIVKGEEDYYTSIEKDLIDRIAKERSSGQQATSRRFVTTNSSCMSYLRFIHREDKDVLDVVFRSTNVPKNLKTDLDFAIYAALRAQTAAGVSSRKIEMRVHLNCAHIVP